MRIYTRQEALAMLKNNPDLYSEIAIEYPCLNLPIKENCDKCHKPKECPVQDAE